MMKPPLSGTMTKILLPGPDVALVHQLLEQHEHRRRADVAARGEVGEPLSSGSGARPPFASSSTMRVRKNCDE